MTASVFCATSVDGFIARADGAIDWLPEAPEDHGFEAFIANVDAIVMGRHSFETVLSFGTWPYGTLRVVVLSSRPLDLGPAEAQGGVVEQMGGEPTDVVARLAARGIGRLYVDGGVTIQRFLRAGLVDRMIVTRVPVLIGDGIPLFGSLPQDVRLDHVATRAFPSGLVQTEYAVRSRP